MGPVVEEVQLGEGLFRDTDLIDYAIKSLIAVGSEVVAVADGVIIGGAVHVEAGWKGLVTIQRGVHVDPEFVILFAVDPSHVVPDAWKQGSASCRLPSAVIAVNIQNQSLIAVEIEPEPRIIIELQDSHPG